MTSEMIIQGTASAIIVLFALYQTYLFYSMHKILKAFKKEYLINWD